MWYKITPNDTLFFRDGKPFTMGMETWAEITFPPTPSTLYGAIRSWLIFEKGDLKSFKNGKLKEELGTVSEKGTLKIKGPFLLLKGEPLFPCPKDLLKEKAGKENKLYRLTFSKKPEIFVSDYPFESSLLEKNKKVLEEAEGFIAEIYLKEYLSGKNSIRLTHKSEIYIEEPKIGIARENKKKTAKEGHLYRIPMIRLKDKVSIAVKIEGVENIPESGIIQLGGEGKTAKIEKLEDNFLKDIEEINFNIENNIFKLYLATPCIFENGYLPKWINENSLEGEFNHIKLKLACCSIGRHKLIGGWNIAKKSPKPMFRTVPEGSVYYFQILDNSDFKKISDTFHFKCISERYPEEGYGLSFIGV